MIEQLDPAKSIRNDKEMTAKKISGFIRSCSSPRRMQEELFSWKYNHRDTLRSAATAIHQKEAHCMEAALAAAFLLEFHGYPPVVMSFESQDGLDHVIYVFREHKTHGRFGAIARSRDLGLHGRPAIYKSPRQLAQSYLDPYVDKTGRITAFQCFHLDETGTNWRYAKGNVWPAETYLLNAKHTPINLSEQRYRHLRKNYLRNGPMVPRPEWWFPEVNP